ncbi:MAG TPA: hypothetical protein VGM77_08060 [Gemmatimonadales bacterium]|jgi:hypothetical protein
MRRRLALLVAVTLAAGACSDALPPVSPPPAASAVRSTSRDAARERLAQALARALADPATRAAVKHRLDQSNAPEGKLQFQALLHANQGTLLASIARSAATSPAELLADLDAARNLELYLPVAAQRAAWAGDANYLVGTVGHDGDQPIGFDPTGARLLLDPRTPPRVPVLALVAQETDFTRGHPDQMMACVDMCGGDSDGGGGGSGGYGGGNLVNPPSGGLVPGLYLTQSHISGSYESWLKGDPEYEYHVYGLGDSGATVQLACTSETGKGGYYYDQNDPDWSGAALLFSDAAYADYQAKHPGAPIRIMAWEDDDEACVDHADGNGVSALVTAVDNAYKQVTSGKLDPTILRGIRAAPSIFSLLTAIHNIILTNDDFIGNGVDGLVAGDAPSGYNWVLKSDGTTTTGWFAVQHMP